MNKTKPISISKRWVYMAYQKVKSNKGSGGVDGVSLQEFEKDYRNHLYKVWNQMSSGSYMPPPIKLIEIPKKGGGLRPLGIATIADRIGQTVVRGLLEPVLEPLFHTDSYGYRPNKSVAQALAQARVRCWKQSWVIDLDIKGFFDNIPHDLLMKAVRKHCDCKWMLLYIERWLVAPLQLKDGTIVARTKGVPQGSIIALRTHSQTLSSTGRLKLKGESFYSIIKSIIFMINGKITELGTGQAYQSGVYIAAEGKTFAANSREVDREVWSVSNTGLSLYKPCKRDQREDGYTGKFRGVYCQTTTLADQADQEIIWIKRSDDQQSGPHCAGRIFSQEGSCQKRRNKLRYHLPMIVCGNKSSRRFTISLFQPTDLLFSLNNLLMN